MTEYDRTPIEVADMQWGDLIDCQNWSDPRYFVGLDPTIKDWAVFSRHGESESLYAPLCPSNSWQKLTPKPEPVLCKHCGEEIRRVGSNWVHDLDRLNCRHTYATPATESETA